ncbi:MAG TPA: RuBisCO large subunit C-terminal-like domain-containing protein [Gemmatimonadales bacterium]|nr:RuBisCO large subunit C-terminal-like domain-containing protein [Gemmatimonadales bacterium]
MPHRPDDALRVTYLVRAAASDIAARAEALMLEQATELPRAAVEREPWVAAHILGRVDVIAPAGEGLHHVTIAHPLATAAGDPAQLLNVLFGNSSLQPDVVLADVDLPTTAFEWLPGPRAGVAGLRSLTGVNGRPVLATALKPMGLQPPRLASLCATFARAGIDVVKDDHGLADHPFCPFEARVEACLRAVEDASRDTGRLALYVPNLVGTPGRIWRQLAFARDAGVRAVLLSPMLTGLPLLHEMASLADGVAVIAHPSFAGVQRILEPVLLGKLFRWYGADAVVFPHAGGRFSYDTATCAAIAAQLRAAHPCARPAMPAPAGGIRVERVAAMLDFYGPDCMLLIGGSLYEAGEALFERTRALVDQVSRAASREAVP